jgi:hypothetical protein
MDGWYQYWLPCKVTPNRPDFGKSIVIVFYKRLDYYLLPTSLLYSGTIDREKVYFKRQVDDFAIACKDERTANIIYDAIDDALQMPWSLYSTAWTFYNPDGI